MSFKVLDHDEQRGVGTFLSGSNAVRYLVKKRTARDRQSASEWFLWDFLTMVRSNFWRARLYCPRQPYGSIKFASRKAHDGLLQLEMVCRALVDEINNCSFNSRALFLMSWVFFVRLGYHQSLKRLLFRSRFAFGWTRHPSLPHLLWCAFLFRYLPQNEWPQSAMVGLAAGLWMLPMNLSPSRKRCCLFKCVNGSDMRAKYWRRDGTTCIVWEFSHACFVIRPREVGYSVRFLRVR